MSTLDFHMNPPRKVKEMRISAATIAFAILHVVAIAWFYSAFLQNQWGKIYLFEQAWHRPLRSI